LPAFAAAVAWIPTAVVLATPLLVLAAVWLCVGVGRRPGGDDAPGSDDGPGGSRVRPPDPPLPTGPVSWPEFERQFAAYVRHEARRDDVRSARGERR